MLPKPEPPWLPPTLWPAHSRPWMLTCALPLQQPAALPMPCLSAALARGLTPSSWRVVVAVVEMVVG
jgi:hypothetical protein